MTERGEYSPARWYRLKLYKMGKQSVGSGDISFYPRAEIPTIVPNESYIEKNNENKSVVVFDANLPEDVTSS